MDEAQHLPGTQVPQNASRVLNADESKRDIAARAQHMCGYVDGRIVAGSECNVRSDLASVHSPTSSPVSPPGQIHSGMDDMGSLGGPQGRWRWSMGNPY